ncbi:hypothetical protein K435DRAFT_785803 [Dendrothele bispora CBS 962.96]|uniref:Uncharacterized protein n=1 Tax=Dendrothele bispora (strain CBS 962.96) TaxID=1314807 RepID=A0A4S8KUJ4_DENBC|nr:hypothetical protein K435DRAFT_785803 [Dendrothele bispora CBS 962.96]
MEEKIVVQLGENVRVVEWGRESRVVGSFHDSSRFQAIHGCCGVLCHFSMWSLVSSMPTSSLAPARFFSSELGILSPGDICLLLELLHSFLFSKVRDSLSGLHYVPRRLGSLSHISLLYRASGLSYTYICLRAISCVVRPPFDKLFYHFETSLYHHLYLQTIRTPSHSYIYKTRAYVCKLITPLGSLYMTLASSPPDNTSDS